MAEPETVMLTSSKGNAYLFAREADLENAWHAQNPAAPPLEFITIHIAGECDKPTPAHTEFIDSFLLCYPIELGPKIEPVVNNCAQSMDEGGTWAGLDIYLPANVEKPVHWSLQYSFDSEELDSFGIFIEMEDDEIIDVSGVD